MGRGRRVANVEVQDPSCSTVLSSLCVLLLPAAECWFIATTAGKEMKKRSKRTVVSMQHVEKHLLTKSAIDLIYCLLPSAGAGKATAQSHS